MSRAPRPYAGRSGMDLALLWLDGEDLRELTLLERKARLKAIVPSESRLLYLDHIEEQGIELFEMCCEMDLEGSWGSRR